MDAEFGCRPHPVVPSGGGRGETEFCDMQMAFGALDAPVTDRLSERYDTQPLILEYVVRRMGNDNCT